MMLCIIGSAFIVLGLTQSVHLVQAWRSDEQNSTAVSAGNFSINITSSSHTYHGRHIFTTNIDSFLLGLGICVLNGLSDVIYFYCSKTLNDHVEHVLVLDFWYLVGSIIFTSLLMLGLEHNRLTLPTQVDDIVFLTTHSLTTAVAHILNYVLLTLLPFIAIGILVNLEIPLAMLCQYVIVPQFQPIRGGVFDLCGTVLITAGLVLPSLGELWHWKCKQTEQDGEDSELIPLSKSE